jgi:hypothetical protein
MTSTMESRRLWIVSTSLIVALLVIAACAVLDRWPASQAAPEFRTTYQAVVLDSGQVFYGKLEGFGTAFPVLREVYYYQQVVNTENHQFGSMLLKRSKQLHSPDYMVLNGRHIIMVESVTPDSTTHNAIIEAKHR